MAHGEIHLHQKKWQYCPKVNRPVAQLPCETAQRQCIQQQADTSRVLLKLVAADHRNHAEHRPGEQVEKYRDPQDGLKGPGFARCVQAALQTLSGRGLGGCTMLWWRVGQYAERQQHWQVKQCGA